MAATEPTGPAPAGPDPGTPVGGSGFEDLTPTAAPSTGPRGDEPVLARVPDRVLLGAVVVLLAVLLLAVVVSLVLLHQPALSPVPVPSVSQV